MTILRGYRIGVAGAIVKHTFGNNPVRYLGAQYHRSKWRGVVGRPENPITGNHNANCAELSTHQFVCCELYEKLVNRNLIDKHTLTTRYRTCNTFLYEGIFVTLLFIIFIFNLPCCHGKGFASTSGRGFQAL